MKNIVVAIFAIVLSVGMVHAQDTEKKKDIAADIDKLFVKLKDSAKPVIYVDEKKFDFPLELIDQSKIASVFVVKDAEKIKKYDAPDGLIFITTKTKAAASGTSIKNMERDKQPMIIVDGKVQDKATLETLSPETIESVSVLKGEAAQKKYNAPNGVIIIKTKK